MQVLADDVNFGYSRLDNLQLLEVDGQPVRDMRHLAQLLQEPATGSQGGSGYGGDSSSADGSCCDGSGSSSGGGSLASSGGSDREGAVTSRQLAQPEQQQQQQQGEQQQGEQQGEQWQQQRGRFVRFTLEKNQVIILDRQEARQALPCILETHRIPAPCSKDLRDAGMGAAGGEQVAAVAREASTAGAA